MAQLAPIFAQKQTAARLLDMKPAEFLVLVDNGFLPRAKDIGGFLRWEVDELRRIIRGDAIDGMGGVKW